MLAAEGPRFELVTTASAAALPENPRLPVRAVCVEDGAGFEPAEDATVLSGLANRRLKPLGHPSVGPRRGLAPLSPAWHAGVLAAELPRR